MNDLRLVLLGVGVLLIAAVWIWSLYARRRAHRSRTRPGGSDARGSGRRRGETRSAHRGGRAAPSRAQRGENLALDLDLGLEPRVGDRDPESPPLGLDPLDVDEESRPRNRASRKGISGDFDAGDESARAGRSQRRGPERDTRSSPSERPRKRGRAPFAGDADPTERAAPDSPAGGWIAAGLQGLRATRDEPEQLEMGTFESDVDGAHPGAHPGAEAGGVEGAAADGDEPADEGLVVILTVLAPEGEKLEGAALRAALEVQGLRHGDDRIFHRFPDGAPAGAGPLFSAVNVVEPGVFDLETMDSILTPGVGLFMRLPGPKDPGNAFAVMVDVARGLAHALEAQLCDETRGRLTEQALDHLHEEIAEYARRRLLRA